MENLLIYLEKKFFGNYLSIIWQRKGLIKALPNIPILVELMKIYQSDAQL